MCQKVFVDLTNSPKIQQKMRGMQTHKKKKMKKKKKHSMKVLKMRQKKSS